MYTLFVSTSLTLRVLQHVKIRNGNVFGNFGEQSVQIAELILQSLVQVTHQVVRVRSPERGGLRTVRPYQCPSYGRRLKARKLKVWCWHVIRVLDPPLTTAFKEISYKESSSWEVATHSLKPLHPTGHGPLPSGRLPLLYRSLLYQGRFPRLEVYRSR